MPRAENNWISARDLPLRRANLLLPRVLAGLLLATLALAAAAQRPQATASELRAAYLYRFLSFVEWPPRRFASARAPIVVALAGASEVADELEAIVRGRAAQGRPILVRRLRGRDDAQGAHLVFVGDGAAARLAALSAAVEPATLVVANGELALERGAMIGFVELQGRLRFVVALDAAERGGLRISSRMLAVASDVRGRHE
jgi:hypothetical protein